MSGSSSTTATWMAAEFTRKAYQLCQAPRVRLTPIKPVGRNVPRMGPSPRRSPHELSQHPRPPRRSPRCAVRTEIAASLALAHRAHLRGLAPTGLVNLPARVSPLAAGSTNYLEL